MSTHMSHRFMTQLIKWIIRVTHLAKFPGGQVGGGRRVAGRPCVIAVRALSMIGCHTMISSKYKHTAASHLRA